MIFGTFVRLKTPDEAFEAFSALREDGFDCCHLVYKPDVYTKKDAEIIKAAAEKSGLEISALFAGYKDNFTKWNLSTDFEDAGINSVKYGEERIKYLKEAAVFCTYLGVKNFLIHAGFVANNPYSEEYKFMLAKVKEVASFLNDLGITLLLETGGESPITHLRLVKDCALPNVAANLDTANVIMYGFGSPVEAIYTLGEHIKSVHIKDGMPPTNPDELGKETEFGQGYVDFGRVFRELKKIGYNGPIIIEREIPDDNRREEIKKTLKMIKPVLLG